MDDNIPLIIFFLIVLTIILSGLSLWYINLLSYSNIQQPINHEYLTVQNNSLIAITPINYVRPITYGTLIDCLIQKESSGNPNAVGDKGLAFGILQYHRATFDHFCGKYKLNLDYKNPDHQIRLCDLMLEENFSNVRHWSVYKQCLK